MVLVNLCREIDSIQTKFYMKIVHAYLSLWTVLYTTQKTESALKAISGNTNTNFPGGGRSFLFMYVKACIYMCYIVATGSIYYTRNAIA